MAAIKAFEKRWYDTEPMTILFYPEDAIAVNPKLTGFAGDHLQSGVLPAAGELDDRRRQRRSDRGLRFLATAEFADSDVHHRLP